MPAVGVHVGVGRRRHGTGGGSGGASMPAGAIGLWYADEVQTSPRMYIPNKMAVGGTPVNLLAGTRRMFAGGADYSFYSGAVAATFADEAATDEDGNLAAASLTTTTSAWAATRTVSNLPAGTYTMVVRVKRNAASDQTFCTRVDAATSAVRTATASWQTFSQVFTKGSTSNTTLYLINDGATTAQLLVADWELYEGDVSASPPKEPALVGHMSIGPDAYNKPPTAAGEIDLSAAGTLGLAQFLSNLNLSAGFTVVSIGRKTAASSGYVAALSQRLAFLNTSALMENNNAIGFNYNGIIPFPGTVAATWQWLNRGWHSWTHRASPTDKSIWIDGGKVHKNVGAYSAATLRDFWMSSIRRGSFGGGWRWNAIALYNRELTDDEIRQAEAALFARASTHGIARGDVRHIVVEGDSLTAPAATTYPSIEASNLSPNPIVLNLAVGGSRIDGVSPNLAERVDLVNTHLAANRSAASRYILSVMITNGVTVGGVLDTSYLPKLAAYCDARRSEGWKVLLCTLPPRATSQTGHNAARNVINPEIRKWVVGDGSGSIVPGVHCDAICDFAADPTYGTDAAGDNTTYYPDGTHPTTAVQTAYLGPLWRAAVNAIT